MTVTIEVKDKKQLDFVERVRGKKSAEEFLQACLQAGLQLVDANMRKAATEQALHFPGTTDDFKTLELEKITKALKENDQKNPVTVEVSRLVNLYTAQFAEFARRNGNKLPSSMTIKTHVPIEQVAFRITADVIKNAIKSNPPAALAGKEAPAKEAKGKKGG